jgi:hypothetical protein
VTILKDAVAEYVKAMPVSDMEEIISSDLMAYYEKIADPDERSKFICDWCDGPAPKVAQ